MKTVFIAMPFGEKKGYLNKDSNSAITISFDRVYTEIIKPCIPDGWESVRSDELLKHGNINDKFLNEILNAEAFIADLTFDNPNVYYELGIRQILSKKATIHVAQQGSELPFDVKTQGYIPYDIHGEPGHRQFRDDVRSSIMGSDDEAGGILSHVHRFLPGLFVKQYKDGTDPVKIREELEEKIKALETAANTRVGLAEQFERQRILKAELTELLRDLVKLQIQNTRLLKEHANDPAYINALSSAFNQENAILLSDATNLATQLSEQVGSVELTTIATALMNFGDMDQAEDYYIKSIDAAESMREKSLTQRFYAAFLANTGRAEEAGKYFQLAVNNIEKNDDTSHRDRGIIFQNWYISELNHQNTNQQKAEELHVAAEKEFSGITNPMLKDQMLTTLYSMQGGQPQAQNSSGDFISGFKKLFEEK